MHFNKRRTKHWWRGTMVQSQNYPLKDFPEFTFESYDSSLLKNWQHVMEEGKLGNVHLVSLLCL